MTLAVADGVATITLDRPEAHNAINEEFTGDLLELVTSCADRDDVRSVLIRGTGRMFTAGGDLLAFAGLAAQDLSSMLHRMTRSYHDALERITRMDAPVVAAVNGPAAGGGLGIVLAADIVVAAPSATFTLGYARLGLTADGGTSWLLPRLGGLRLAQRMFLLNEQLTAEDAAAHGLVTEVCDDVDARARELADQLARGPTTAFGGMKRLLRDAAVRDLGDHLVAETDSMSTAALGPDAAEGIAAFAGRRPPEFTGR